MASASGLDPVLGVATFSGPDDIGTIATHPLLKAAQSHAAPQASWERDGPKFDDTRGQVIQGFFPSDSLQTGSGTFVVLHAMYDSLRVVRIDIVDGCLSYGPTISARKDDPLNRPKLRMPREELDEFKETFGRKGERLSTCPRLLPDGGVCYIDDARLFIMDAQLKLRKTKPLVMQTPPWRTENHEVYANYLRADLRGNPFTSATARSLDGHTFFLATPTGGGGGRSCSYTALWSVDIDSGRIYPVHNKSVPRPRKDVPDTSPAGLSGRRGEWDGYDEMNMTLAGMPGVLRDAQLGQLAQVSMATPGQPTRLVLATWWQSRFGGRDPGVDPSRGLLYVGDVHGDDPLTHYVTWRCVDIFRGSFSDYPVSFCCRIVRHQAGGPIVIVGGTPCEAFDWGKDEAEMSPKEKAQFAEAKEKEARWRIKVLASWDVGDTWHRGGELSAARMSTGEGDMPPALAASNSGSLYAFGYQGEDPEDADRQTHGTRCQLLKEGRAAECRWENLKVWRIRHFGIDATGTFNLSMAMMFGQRLARRTSHEGAFFEVWKQSVLPHIFPGREAATPQSAIPEVGSLPSDTGLSDADQSEAIQVS